MSKVYNRSTTAYAASLVVSVNPSQLCGLTGYNSLAATQFVQIHDAASLPAEGAVPVIMFEVSASAKFAVDFGANPRSFNTGIIVCNSTTGPTKTIGAANCWFDVQSRPATNDE